MKWFYLEGSGEQGPFDKEMMQELVRQGVIKNDTQVRNDRDLGWTTYARLVEMASNSSSRSQKPPAEGEQPSEPGTDLSTDRCSECGDHYAASKLVTYRGRRICSSCSPALLQKIGQGLAEDQYAGFWIRFLAKFIDGLILFIPLMAFNAALAFRIPEMDFLGNYSGDITTGAAAGLALVYLLQVALPLGYSTFFIGRYAATPGKLMLGLRVIQPGGGRVSYSRALGRSLAELLSRITLYIGYIMAGFDNEKRALHDHIAGTRVIKKPAGGKSL